MYSFSIVLVLPPAPAARVLAGLWFAILSFLSAAARRLRSVFGPPGTRGVLAPEFEAALAPGELTGELGLGDDMSRV